ncbi:hypothetical protein [Chitiniphilus shinanonensis]
MKQRQQHHENKARELRFIADHLVDAEDYLLGDQDLTKIGVLNSPHW